MKFLLFDVLTNEISGLFETKEEAEYYYLKKYIVERLKFFLYKICSKSELMENIDLIREYDDLINEIIFYEKDDNYIMKFNYFINFSDKLLYNYSQIDNKEIHNDVSSTNFKIFLFNDDKISIFKINKKEKK
jgi:hypothetical protein